MKSANTISINIKEKYDNYQKMTADNFLAVDSIEKGNSVNPGTASTVIIKSMSTKIEEYNQETGILKIIICHALLDINGTCYDRCLPGNTTIYLVESSDIANL